MCAASALPEPRNDVHIPQCIYSWAGLVSVRAMAKREKHSAGVLRERTFLSMNVCADIEYCVAAWSGCLPLPSLAERIAFCVGLRHAGCAAIEASDERAYVCLHRENLYKVFGVPKSALSRGTADYGPCAAAC